MKPWGGRFREAPDPRAEQFTASLAVDRRLWPHDLTASEAWARALERAGLLSAAECAEILRGLGEVRVELAAGSFPFRPELEDIHTNIERRLEEKVGAVAGKLHTGRSRNDQIAVDERLYLKEAIVRLRRGLAEIQSALIDRATEMLDAPMPGYTHLQRAQPVLVAHHLLSNTDSFGWSKRFDS